MKNMKRVTVLLALLLTASCQGFAETASAPVVPSASETASVSASIPDPSEFPLMLKGMEVLISKGIKREDLSARLTKIVGENTQMEEKSRLQYDFQTDEESAPMALVFDWDTAGKIAEIILDGENPPVKDLRAWLSKTAGPGKTRKEKGYKTTTWKFKGWSFSFREGGSGEDTAYSFTIAPQKSK